MAIFGKGKDKDKKPKEEKKETYKPEPETAEHCEDQEVYKKLPEADPSLDYVLELHPGSSSEKGMRLKLPQEMLANTFDQVLKYATGQDTGSPRNIPTRDRRINDRLGIEMAGQGQGAQLDYGKYGVSLLAELVEKGKDENEVKFCVVETIHYDKKKSKEDGAKDVLTEKIGPYFKKHVLKTEQGGKPVEVLYNSLEIVVASNLAGGAAVAAVARNYRRT